ncbi:MAG: STAS domain-containing protein [Gammaproteobacteria bacterium]|nr:STAS domain-containing protein [Gammaproteobacteria bacterium]MDD9874557.1 STAS domain-containing protein [Gammaproteobacteria bacterium]
MPAGLSRDRGRIALAGDLTSRTVPALFAQTPRFGAGAADASAPLRIDLRAVGEVDSSGLALLLHWANTAAAGSSGKLTFTGAPPQLCEMAKITGLEALLNLAGGGS